MNSQQLPVVVVGGGIGGLAAALALVSQGFKVQLFEQAKRIGEIGAGIQLGPNAFHAFDALGVGEKARSRAVFIDSLVMHDAIDERLIASLPTGEAFCQRFGNPYAVIHRVDAHLCLLEKAQETGAIHMMTATRIERIEQSENFVTVYDCNGKAFHAQAAIAADGVRSVARQIFVKDLHRVTGHVVYRAVVEKEDFPEDLRWNAASIWVGPNCHLVHYPLRGGEQYNLVVTFHARGREEWSIRDGSREEVQSYFQEVCPKARQLIDLPQQWRRWATADFEPIARWSFERVTLLGDAAHPTTQYMAQGACMALEDAVTLGQALRVYENDIVRALDLYQRSRVARCARIVLSSREMGRLYHAKGVERLVRNDLWQGRSVERFYDAVEWLYGWRVSNCLAKMTEI